MTVENTDRREPLQTPEGLAAIVTAPYRDELLPLERLAVEQARKLAGRGEPLPPMTALLLVSLVDRLAS